MSNEEVQAAIAIQKHIELLKAIQVIVAAFDTEDEEDQATGFRAIRELLHA
jgi:hypothetical protein